MASCHGDPYGKTLATDLLERLRPDARFDSLDELIAQMALDKAAAREVLAREALAREEMAYRAAGRKRSSR